MDSRLETKTAGPASGETVRKQLNVQNHGLGKLAKRGLGTMLNSHYSRLAYMVLVVGWFLLKGQYPLYHYYKDSIFAKSTFKIAHVHAASSLFMWLLYMVLSSNVKKASHRVLGYIYYGNFVFLFAPSGCIMTLQLEQESQVGTLISKLLTLEILARSCTFTFLSFYYVLQGNISLHKHFNQANIQITTSIILHRLAGFIAIRFFTENQALIRLAGDIGPFLLLDIRTGLHIRFIFDKRTSALVNIKDHLARRCVFRWVLYLVLIVAYTMWNDVPGIVVQHAVREYHSCKSYTSNCTMLEIAFMNPGGLQM
mmetsp:Transcript_34185/g.54747  ORF Transcript_34185/g.54747 Transcript_34185/m.54747 type:complete len:311 (-) Transcript_34185:138-1070(-)